jgi:protein TonB
MIDHHDKKRFLKLPKYPGGSKALTQCIAENMRYPQAAAEAGIEGSVIVEYDIDDNGAVSHIHVLKGLGHGCDEEAVRLVSLLRFEKVRNRGVRVKMTNKTSIRFILPKTNISYTVSYTGKNEKPKPGPASKGSDQVVYEYTIRL